MKINPRKSDHIAQDMSSRRPQDAHSIHFVVAYQDRDEHVP